MNYPLFLEWVPFDRFKDVKQIGEGGFAKVYSATWIDGKAKYKRQNDESWKKEEPKPIKVALKKLNDSQNISANYLNEIKILWIIYFNNSRTDQGNLRSILSSNFNIIFWNESYSDNRKTITYVSDFGLSGQSNEQKSDDKICGVLPYIAPEVLNGEPYTLSSDIYSFGVIMTELSFGKPPFYNRKHDISLVLEICNGNRPEFGKGTPEIYKKLAYRCMSAIPNQRPTADELYYILNFWYYSSSTYTDKYQNEEKFGYKRKEIKAIFDEADKEIPNISTSYEKNPDAIYTSRVFTFSNLPKPVNSSIINSYLEDDENNKDCQDSKLFDLEVPN
ncbi:unnamed protein product [Rhizophagus irregularis]|nr:unnamed protein product [Rhizophagus irregularis]